MVNQYKDKIDLAQLDKEKKIWSREVPLVGNVIYQKQE
ncbi:transmembrane protein [Pasteurella canis]|nr:transmembrane protein [Pasteurella canis]